MLIIFSFGVPYWTATHTLNLHMLGLSLKVAQWHILVCTTCSALETVLHRGLGVRADIQHGLLEGCGQGHVIPISRAVSRLRGTSLHHGLLVGCGQGHVIPLSRAVSRLMGTSLHHGLLVGCRQGAGSCARPLRAPAGTPRKLNTSAKLSANFFCTFLELYCQWCQQQPCGELLLRPGLVSSPRADVGLCFHT